MSYPQTLSEEETLRRALDGASISRVGEGELKIALGRDCVSQVANRQLSAEMKAVLTEKTEGLLPCIPRIWDEMPNFKFWGRFREAQYTSLLRKEVVYGSAFITRPDSATNIDNDAYWDDMTRLWRGRDVTLVIGSTKSLVASALADAASVRVVWGSRRDSYARIDEIEQEIGTPSGPIIMCLGATATVLAPRLAKKKLWALDLGHVGMFMPHHGAYKLGPDDLISREYAEIQKQMHASRPYGSGGGKHADEVARLCRVNSFDMVLDYGCGEGKLETPAGVSLFRYDPGIPGLEALPKPAHLVVCTDVLEHVEPDKLGAVLAHIFKITKVMAYMVIATRPANKNLPDGRNAHLTIQPAEWWIERIKQAGWMDINYEVKKGHSVKVWAKK